MFCSGSLNGKPAAGTDASTTKQKKDDSNKPNPKNDNNSKKRRKKEKTKRKQIMSEMREEGTDFSSWWLELMASERSLLYVVLKTVSVDG